MVIGIILASGFSNRMGQDKLLLEVEGKKILERVILATKSSQLDDIVLVYRTEEVKELAERYNIKTLYNKNAKLGQSQSVILGVQEANGDAYMFFVGDQPYLSANLIDKLILEHKGDKNKIVIPYFNNNICMPILFPSNFRENLLQVEGDKGGKEIIANNPDMIIRVDVEEEKLICDIDTLEDYEKII